MKWAGAKMRVNPVCELLFAAAAALSAAALPVKSQHGKPLETLTPRPCSRSKACIQGGGTGQGSSRAVSLTWKISTTGKFSKVCELKS